MKAAVLHKAHDLRIQEVPKPTIGPAEVLVKIKAVGICGSDMHLFHEGSIGNTVLAQPLVLGHEAAGEVVEVGQEVSSFSVGDRVALEPGVPCRQCAYCKRGEYHLCPSVQFHGVPSADGFFAEYVAMPSDFVFRLPDSLDFVQGAMLEPFAVGLQAATEGAIKPGESVAILGSGPIGLSTLQAVTVRGATNTMVVDVVDKRLKMAAELGAQHTINATKVDVVAEIARLTDGLGADVVFETAGAVPTTQQSVQAVRRGGTVVMVGVASQANIALDVVRIVRSRLNVKGCFRYVNQYPTAIALAKAGKVDLTSAVTHTFSLDELPEALDFCIKNKDVAIKSVVTF
ncbi:MAG: NAD(P)-dependent alcohol dehydrogenase [Dehalococcoidales bacterium]|nr:NAD(P)-dependent alcohol dehydrogenase [Dehalococcoidales bacterium]